MVGGLAISSKLGTEYPSGFSLSSVVHITKGTGGIGMAPKGVGSQNTSTYRKFHWRYRWTRFPSTLNPRGKLRNRVPKGWVRLYSVPSVGKVYQLLAVPI